MSRKRWGEGKFGISPFSLTPILLSLFWHPLLIKLNEIHIFVTASAKATWKRLSKQQKQKEQTENRKGSDNSQRLLTAAAFTAWNNATLGKFAFRSNVYCLADEDYIFRNRLFYSKIYWLCRYSLKLWTFSLQCGKWEGRQNIE